MKVAIFHNYMDNIGGAERVGLTLARELGGDIYTTNIDRQKIIKMGFEDVLPRIHSIGWIPVNAPYRQQIALWRFRRLNLGRKYDFYIIDGDWAMSGAVNNKPNMWYIHSPIREIWDLYEYTRKSVPFHAKLIFDAWVILNRHLNREYIKHVNILVSNSTNTRNRVMKYLKRTPVVINPPIETKSLPKSGDGGYWLSVNRLIMHKRVDLQLKAFSRLPGERLVIVGSHEQSKHFLKYAALCNRLKPVNVEIRKWVAQDELLRLYADCKGFITTSHDEDFGMNVVEAMAFGKPVIAPDEGGYKESILDGKTGLLIDGIDEVKLRDAVFELSVILKDDPERYKKACLKLAAKFDTGVFIKKILASIAGFHSAKKQLTKKC